MPLPASPNAISFSQVNTELGLSSTAQISLNDAAVRSLFGKASGAISMSDGHGKSAAFSASITTNQQEMNLRTFAVNAGWDQSSIATITLNSNIYAWSNNVSTPAMTINGSWPGGVTLINNGFIIGRGGNGGQGVPATTPQGGGTAISLGVNVTITNNSTIAGGGGGGGGNAGGGGGGAGGGQGAVGRGATGGTGGGLGQAGSSGGATPVTAKSGSGGGAGGGGGGFGFYAYPSPRAFGGGGGGGGRILPGSGGAGGASGAGGAGGGAGGAGGSASSGGSIGNSSAGGGGGGWGAAGGTTQGGTSPTRDGAAGGRCVHLNGFTATFTVNGTRFGAIS